jgi:hypothetical protein
MERLNAKNECPFCHETKNVSYERIGTSAGTASLGIGVIEGQMTSYFYCEKCFVLFDVTTNYKRQKIE